MCHVLRKCIDCRKRNEAPPKQLMADLPKKRLTPYDPPFTYTGVDFFGPFYVKRGRGTNKVYGCLFICFTSRAVHIEDVSSLETEINCSLCPMPQWKFKPPGESHMNGVWKRLIRSVCKTMNAILGNQNALIGLEAFRTVFAEVVIVLNSRPLTPSSDDPRDPEPLTPNHHLLQRKHLALPPGLFVYEDL